jgi:formylglycine-generating enzyme required for sulfatase activity
MFRITKILSFAALLVSRNVPQCALAVTIPTVPIGNPGNPADTRYTDSHHPSGVGAVAYSFNIGTTEVTNAQYVEFLNAVAVTDTYGLYSTDMGSTTWAGIVRSGASGSYAYAVKPAALSGIYLYDDKPVVCVSFGDAMRFVNWLHNGQPSGLQGAGTTEDGAYSLYGALTNAALAAVTRSPGARWWLPSEDEWYKAAYHKNDGVTGNYWDYPTGTNSVPNNNPPSFDTGNSANFFDLDNFCMTGDCGYPLTNAGAYTLSDSPYGTFDQGGNVFEWNETLFNPPNGSFRGYRSGSWDYFSGTLSASYWSHGAPTDESVNIGFRIASIPEPSTTCLGPLGAFVLFWWRPRRCLRLLRTAPAPRLRAEVHGIFVVPTDARKQDSMPLVNRKQRSYGEKLRCAAVRRCRYARYLGDLLINIRVNSLTSVTCLCLAMSCIAVGSLHAQADVVFMTAQINPVPAPDSKLIRFDSGNQSFLTDTGGNSLFAGVTILNGELLVADRYSNQIQRFDPDGSYLGLFTSQGPASFLESDSDDNVYGAGSSFSDPPNTLAIRLNSAGAVTGTFSHPSIYRPRGIDADASGNVYLVGVSVFDPASLYKFASDGTFLNSIPLANDASDISIDEVNQRLYLAQGGLGGIGIYDISGTVPVLAGAIATAVSSSIFGVHYAAESGNILATDVGSFSDDPRGLEYSPLGTLVAEYRPANAYRALDIVTMVPEPRSMGLVSLTFAGFGLTRSPRRRLN